MASTLAAYVLLRGSRKTSSHTLECIPILGRTRPWLDEFLELLAALRRHMGGFHSSRTRLCFEKLLRIITALIRQKYVRMVLATKARERPNTQDKAERLKVATGHIFEDVIAHYHHLVLLERAVKIIQQLVGFPTALEEIRCGTSPAVCS